MLHHELPIYRTGCELLKLAMEIRRQMPRDFKRDVGDEIKGLCAKMLVLMAKANKARGAQRAAYINELLEDQHAATVLLRCGHDMRLLSHKLWADSVQLLDGIGKQGGGWLKNTNGKAPAA